MPIVPPDSTLRITDGELLKLRTFNLDERELRLQQQEIGLKLAAFHERKKTFLQNVAKKYGLVGEVEINMDSGEVSCRANGVADDRISD